MMRGSTLNFQRVHRNQQQPLLQFFLNREVVVRCPGFTVRGRLIHYRLSDKKNHRPGVLILRNLKGYVIVRSWISVGVGK